jgi:hypothetical protein
MEFLSWDIVRITGDGEAKFARAQGRSCIAGMSGPIMCALK